MRPLPLQVDQHPYLHPHLGGRYRGQGLCPAAQEEPRLRAGASVRAFATTVASSAPYCLASSPASFPNSFGFSTRRMYTGFGNYTCLGTVGKLG